MTLTAYNAIRVGMTLDQVTRLVGSPGTLSTAPTKTGSGELVEARNWGALHPDVHGSSYVVFIDHVVRAKGQDERE
ncbi:MAG: outer membrane protein assembly factor BamE [Actinomycetota bacterium]|nr:outer membrane protein assembly factor BamE [Actinomycetota bacterium]